MVKTIIPALLACAVAAGLAAQAPVAPASDARQRIDDRIRALQRESERLAGESQTLIGELRKLEVERDLRREEAQQAEAAAADAQSRLSESRERLAALEQERTAQLPDLKAQLVDIYKRGRGGFAHLLLSADGVRDFARATRAVAAWTTIYERRVAEHRRVLAALAAEEQARTKVADELQARETAARQARAAAERAVSQRAALLARIDTERDMAAQLVGELQMARARLDEELTAAPERAPAPAAGAVPLAARRGTLEWPAAGAVVGRFGQTSGRLAGTAARNGIEIAVPEDTAVRAVHGGTIGYAEPFAGLGNLVIVDHGANNYSLYGYLGTIGVARGDQVAAGAELGRAGFAPAGPPALYLEMRIDGRSVDPLQWLRPR